MIKQSALQVLVAALFVLSVFAQARPKADIEGNWIGTFTLGESNLRLAFKFTKTADGFRAKFDSPDQGATDLDIDSVSYQERTLKFDAKRFGFSYEGTLNDAGDEITGTFKQGSGLWPLILKRISEVPTLNRPQDPQKPYPYDEEEVTYRNVKDNVKLAGTLTLPRTLGPRPAVILISGSGSQDRNEAVYGHQPFLILADHLTRNGIAVLRVDDRRVGGSDLGSLSATSENHAEDVLAGIDFLKSRKEINAKRSD